MKHTDLSRDVMLEYLLRPITLKPSPRQDVRSLHLRRKHVQMRHSFVDSAYPFMNKEEQARADAWRIKEAHNELWEPKKW